MSTEVGVRTTPIYTLISGRLGSVTDSQALHHHQTSLFSFIFRPFIPSGCDTGGVFARQRGNSRPVWAETS